MARRIRAAGLSWHVLQYGADAEVLEPESLREEIVRRLGGLGRE